jgi:glycosyltransferase involved in cell wall biosynthesis
LPPKQLGLNITVIVPVRNEETSVAGVIKSLLGQTLPPQEIVVTDAGSVDSSKDIVRELIQAGHPVRLVEDADAFPGRARNLAIAQAHTPWVAMTDAGTIVPPAWLANLARTAVQGKGVDVVFGSYEPILDSLFRECLALAFVPPARMLEEGPFRGPTTASLLVRREVWDALGGFPEELRACEDLIFFNRLGASAWTVGYAPYALVEWNIPGSFHATFRRFRQYSRHTLKAGLGRRWQLAVARMYLTAALLVTLALCHQVVWVALIPLGLAWRVHHSVRTRRPWLKLAHRIGLRNYLLVAVLLLWIDLAAFVGCLHYLLCGDWKQQRHPTRSGGHSSVGKRKN